MAPGPAPPSLRLAIAQQTSIISQPGLRCTCATATSHRLAQQQGRVALVLNLYHVNAISSLYVHSLCKSPPNCSSPFMTHLLQLLLKCCHLPLSCLPDCDDACNMLLDADDAGVHHELTGLLVLVGAVLDLELVFMQNPAGRASNVNRCTQLGCASSKQSADRMAFYKKERAWLSMTFVFATGHRHSPCSTTFLLYTNHH